MSVAELPVPYDEGPDRTPPQDIAAEQSVLGAMMLSRDAIADVVEQLREADFYRPAHGVIYDVILSLYGRGEPADAVTVAAELGKSGEIGRIGGATYLHTLVSLVPTAANAGYYARIVKERAILRRLVEAGTRIVQMGYGGEGEVDDIVDRAQSEVYEVTDRRTSEDYLPLRELMDGALTEIEAISNRGGQLVGVPTGFAELDALTNGLHPGQLVILAARPALGKALALDTPIPTPAGWSTMGALRPGDLVFDEAGRTTEVVAVSETWHHRPCYRLTFSDGSSIVADEEHEWLTRGVRRGGHLPAVRTTGRILATLRTSAGQPAHRIYPCAPLEMPDADVDVAPYALGAWWGARARRPDHRGHPDIEPEIAMRAEDSWPLRGGALTRIPASYLRASQAQRRELLAGVLDAAGSVTRSGDVRVATTSAELAVDLHDLVSSLGYPCSFVVERVPGSPAHAAAAAVVTFRSTDEVFGLHRKALLHKERTASRTEPFHPGRLIVRIEPVPSVPVRCIQVSSPRHLYLAGPSMIPTHNSTLALDVARSASIRNGLTSVIFSLEMGRNEILMRLLSAESQVALHHMRSGNMSDNDWTKLAARMGTVSEAPLFIDDSPNLTMMEIRSKCRRLKQRHDLRLVIVDYMQLMTSGKKVESRQQEVSEFSRSLKLLAKELDVPVIAVSQLNRGPEQRTDKRPMLADLRESGSLEQDADMVILLHREDAYERESPRAGEADFIIAKHRNGPTSTITVAFQGHYSRFVDMAQ